MQYELDRRIENILEPDHLRDSLFDSAHDFILHDAVNVNWNMIEDGAPITNVYSYFCDELKEYIEIIRPDRVNELKSVELNYYDDKISEAALLNLIVEIENEDEYHLHQIVSLRKYMNYAS